MENVYSHRSYQKVEFECPSTLTILLKYLEKVTIYLHLTNSKRFFHEIDYILHLIILHRLVYRPTL